MPKLNMPLFGNTFCSYLVFVNYCCFFLSIIYFWLLIARICKCLYKARHLLFNKSPRCCCLVAISVQIASTLASVPNQFQPLIYFICSTVLRWIILLTWLIVSARILGVSYHYNYKLQRHLYRCNSLSSFTSYNSYSPPGDRGVSWFLLMLMWHPWKMKLF